MRIVGVPECSWLLEARQHRLAARLHLALEWRTKCIADRTAEESTPKLGLQPGARPH
jgi:hypothetical protein